MASPPRGSNTFCIRRRCPRTDVDLLEWFARRGAQSLPLILRNDGHPADSSDDEGNYPKCLMKGRGTCRVLAPSLFALWLATAL
jgi:hypothetical protein